MAKEKKPAVDLQKIINEGRDRKKAQDAAGKVFGKNRVSSAPAKTNGAGSLASRAGVNKRLASSSLGAKPGSLLARIQGPGAILPPTGPKADVRSRHHAETRQNAFLRAMQNPTANQFSLVGNRQSNNVAARDRRRGGLQVASSAITGASRHIQQPNMAMSIRGLAGPHVVEVKNLAPGTTAADVEEAMRRKGIAVHSCRLLQTSPTVIADIVCDTKDDADKIKQFNGQWADDGYQLQVGEPRAAPDHLFRTQPSQNNGVFVDGSMGFEPLEVGNGGNGGLYSDKLVGATHSQNQNLNRRGRGFRGGRGGNNR